MVFYVAKTIQAIGLAGVTYAFVIGVTQDHSMGRELKLMGIGAAIFYAARLLERWGAAEG